jgi:hypothetical protein
MATAHQKAIGRSPSRVTCAATTLAGKKCDAAHCIRSRSTGSVLSESPHRRDGRPLEGEAGIAALGECAREDGTARLLKRPVRSDQEVGAGAEVGLHSPKRVEDLGSRYMGLSS